ncbi:MAG: DUF3536 domain-containing protein [Gemmatimonadales bacterium]|nr:DUF3536 domain-containing protein [Gemmatimonadales bacterium]
MIREPGARQSVVVHAHFYQPPREEPWLDLVEREASAAPAHDWNERIEQECYRAVVAARIPASDGRIARIANTLEQISFNVGPTLVEWLEREAPATWAAMLHADDKSRQRHGGHGNAMAMPYHHSILPLASRRDKETEVFWGIADFRRRFGREPEGMWLPETAVDDETLDVLAAQGIRFTVLAPHQVESPPPFGLPGKYTTRHGRSIALFLYDGDLSHGVAFGPLITDAVRWGNAMLARPTPAAGPSVVSIATDGETYGHHHRFGEMALAAVLNRLATERGVVIENYAAFLARHPAEHPVRLVENTSWSCSHGIERWRSDCGCRTKPHTDQAWRAPLRNGLNWLAGEIHRIFEAEATPLLSDPWRARDAYGTLGPPSHLPVRARELLEMERNALRMFTSCGWFFDDIGGLETIVCLRYAARAIELAGADGPRLAAGLRDFLAAARSNDPALGTGADVFDAALPRHPGPIRAAAGYAVVRDLAPDRGRSTVGAYLVGPANDDVITVRHRRTGAHTEIRTQVRRPARTRPEVDLQPLPAGDGRVLELGDLPEWEAEEARRAIRRELQALVLSDGDRERLAGGTADYRAILGEALLRHLPPDPALLNSADVERMVAALDLFELERFPMFFDAQTRYHALAVNGPPGVRRWLLPFAERFGFAASLAQEFGA